jgi:LysR family transcriptional regulator, glycine cleavage system transcriptional activator
VTFEAAARLDNFTRAASELGVTQVAVRKQIRGLEEFLGIKENRMRSTCAIHKH